MTVSDIDIESAPPIEEESGPDSASPFAGEEAPKRRGRPKGSKNKTSVQRATTPTRRAVSRDPLPQIFGLGWAGLGYGLMTLDPAPPASAAVGKVLQLQAPIAGDVLSNAFKRTPAYPVVKPWLRMIGPWQDLAQLIATPLLVGMVAMRPEIAQAPPVQAILMHQLVPTIAKAKARAEEQQAMVQEVAQYTPEAIADAKEVIGWLMGAPQQEETPEEIRPEPEPQTQQWHGYEAPAPEVSEMVNGDRAD